MKGIDRLLLRSGAILCGILLCLGLFIAPDWPRRMIAVGAALAGLSFFALVIQRYER